jgi:hypothetical protein
MGHIETASESATGISPASVFIAPAARRKTPDNSKVARRAHKRLWCRNK